MQPTHPPLEPEIYTWTCNFISLHFSTAAGKVWGGHKSSRPGLPQSVPIMTQWSVQIWRRMCCWHPLHRAGHGIPWPHMRCSQQASGTWDATTGNTTTTHSLHIVYMNMWMAIHPPSVGQVGRFWKAPQTNFLSQYGPRPSVHAHMLEHDCTNIQAVQLLHVSVWLNTHTRGHISMHSLGFQCHSKPYKELLNK